jgi:hypothetical protein
VYAGRIKGNLVRDDNLGAGNAFAYLVRIGVRVHVPVAKLLSVAKLLLQRLQVKILRGQAVQIQNDTAHINSRKVLFSEYEGIPAWW